MNVGVSLASVLSQIEDELFYAIFDVALDIDQELTVRDTDKVFIPARRDGIRFPILFPEGPATFVSARYVGLREKGLMFLRKQGAIAIMQRRPFGAVSFDGWFITADIPRFVAMLDCLKAEHALRTPAATQLETKKPDAVDHLLQLTGSFHRVALRLRDRRAGKEPLIVEDEYDLQYVLGAMLESRFDDVRPEEWTPSYAGSSSRVDFFLKNEGVFIETKMTRNGLTDRKLGDELTIDIAHYQQHQDCEALVCFVYDPTHRLKNPRGLENDLSKLHGELPVEVIVRPQ